MGQKQRKPAKLLFGVLLVIFGMYLVGSGIYGLLVDEGSEQNGSVLTPEDVWGSLAVDQEDYFVSYDVNGLALSNPSVALTEQQQRIYEKVWSQFSLVAGEELLSNYAGAFSLYNGVNLQTAAHTSLLEKDNYKWRIGINTSEFRTNGEPKSRSTVERLFVHELAHMLLMNKTQIEPYSQELLEQEDVSMMCSTYFSPNEGCSYPDSYVNLFYNQFWLDIYSQSPRDYDGAEQERFYLSNQDKFITKYASIDPAEDMAELYVQLVFADELDMTDPVRQKLEFINSQPDLVAEKVRLRQVLSL